MSVQIFFIEADGCVDCARAKIIIRAAVEKSGIDCEFKLFKFDDRVAINICIKNDIDDIPACVIGEASFQGKNFKEIEIIKAIKAAK